MTPNTVVARFELGVPLVVEVRGLPRGRDAQGDGWEEGMDELEGLREGLLVECDRGTLRFGANWEAVALDLRGEVAGRFAGRAAPLGRFLDRVSASEASEPVAALRTARLAHAANLAYRLGTEPDPADLAAGLSALPELEFAYARMADHLERNGLGPAGGGLVLSPELAFGSDGRPLAPEARGLARGSHRAPYLLPERS